MSSDFVAAPQYPVAAPQFGYRAFGLYLVSNVPLPGLIETPNAGQPEVAVFAGLEPLAFDPSAYSSVWYESKLRNPSGTPALLILTTREGPSSFWLRYQDGTNVFVSNEASTIHFTWPAASCLEEAATYLLGPVMAIVAQLRGTTCLHGSAIAVDGGAIGLLGPQAAGKSTTAAAFAKQGHAVIADDLILLSYSSGGFLVEPSYPVVRLWPATVKLLFGDEDALPPLSPLWEKRALHLNDGTHGYQLEALPLRALYILRERRDDDAAPFLKPLAASAAVIALLSNSWAHYADKPEFLGAQFDVLTRVSRQTPVRQLTAHSDPARLPDLCRLLVDDVRSLQ